MALTFQQSVAVSFDALNNEKAKSADQWSDTSALNFLERVGGVKRIPGGSTISMNLDYRVNQGADFLTTDTTSTSTSKTEVLTMVQADWALLVVPTNWTFKDEYLNADSNQRVDLVTGLAENAMTSHDYTVEDSMFATTGGTDGFNTFIDLFTSNGEGTVHGIVSATETWWMNQFKNKGSDTGATLLADYNTLYFSCSKGSSGRQPNVIIGNPTIYGSYVAALNANQRFLDAASATSGFKEVKHINASFIYTSVLSSAQDDAYMFNTNDTHLVVCKGAFRTRRNPQDFTNAAMVNQKIFSLMQLVTRNRSRGGIAYT